MKNTQKRYVIALAVGSLLCSVAMLLTSRSKPATVFAQQASNTPVVVALGDSITTGVGVESSENIYTERLALTLGIPIETVAQSGATTETALETLVPQVIAQDPDIVIVFIGGNDILGGVPLDTMMANIEAIIREIRQTGSAVVLLGIHGDVFIFNIEERFEAVAEETGVLYVPNVLEDIVGSPTLTADAIHPNDEGHALIASRIEPIVRAAVNDIQESPEPSPSLGVSCAPNKPQVETFETVTWHATVTGTTTGSVPLYTWTDGNTLSGTGQAGTATYRDPGTQEATVTVQDGDRTASSTCSVIVIERALAGSCSVETNIRQSGTTTAYQIIWGARFRQVTSTEGGSIPISWSGSDNMQGQGGRISISYTSAGQKTATATATTTAQTTALTCMATLPEQRQATTTPPLNGGCNLNGTPETGTTLEWQSNLLGGSGPYSVTWSGTDGLNATSSTARITYETPGRKTAVVRITAGDEAVEFSCEAFIATATATSSGNGGCFIATAAFGSELEPELDTLRAFRDGVLLQSNTGTVFVNLYYHASPPLADIIREHETLKAITRVALRPLIAVADIMTE